MFKKLFSVYKAKRLKQGYQSFLIVFSSKKYLFGSGSPLRIMARRKNGKTVKAVKLPKTPTDDDGRVTLHCILDGEITSTGFVVSVERSYRTRFRSRQGAYSWLDAKLLRGYRQLQSMDEALDKTHAPDDIYVRVADPNTFLKIVADERRANYTWERYKN